MLGLVIILKSVEVGSWALVGLWPGGIFLVIGLAAVLISTNEP